MSSRSLLLTALMIVGAVSGFLCAYPVAELLPPLRLSSFLMLGGTLGLVGSSLGIALASFVDACLDRLAARGSVRWPV